MSDKDIYRKIVVDMILESPKKLLSRVEKMETTKESLKREIVPIIYNLEIPIISEDQIKEFAERMPRNGDVYFCMNTLKLIKQTAEVFNSVLIYAGDNVSFSAIEEVQMIVDFLIRFTARLKNYNHGYTPDCYLTEGFVVGFQLVQ